MKFPSFIRLPANKRFNIEPRYYDPIKEEIEERTRRIKEEMDGNPQPGSGASNRIMFERKTQSAPMTSLLQLGIASILGIMIIGWLFYGNQVFYLFWIAVPIYLYFRLKGRRSRRR